MLYPQHNAQRQLMDLSGFWEFRVDPTNIGDESGWHDGFDVERYISVPASWNEQFTDLREYLADAWYQYQFTMPWAWHENRIILRFGSVSYYAEVWLNGVYLGQHEGGHLPFEFDVTEQVKTTDNCLVVKVNGEPQPNYVPPGKVRRDELDNFLRAPQYPDTNYDFFPFCGIHRPVILYATAKQFIQDITVQTDIQGTSGIVDIAVDARRQAETHLRYKLIGHEVDLSTSSTLNEQAQIVVDDARFWSHKNPNLYDLTVELIHNDTVLDAYTLAIGIRTIVVEGTTLLLNGEAIQLYGFGRHEDAHFSGRGFNAPVVIKDYDLLHWVGANSFRTSHYPYAESTLNLADRLGFLVISESPAVEMYFHKDGLEDRLAQWQQSIKDWMHRDKNHPSVNMWSVANEPHSQRPVAKDSFQDMIDLARNIDASRPITFASYLGLKDEALEWSDVICMNRYNGWYYQVAQIEEGVKVLKSELEALYEKYQCPIILSEYGADTVAGNHAIPPVMFSEEYQAEMLSQYDAMLDNLPFIIGRHVWNLCDFATGQSITRVGAMNLKGVFTRERQPKLAAHRLRAMWSSYSNKNADATSSG